MCYVDSKCFGGLVVVPGSESSSRNTRHPSTQNGCRWECDFRLKDNVRLPFFFQVNLHVQDKMLSFSIFLAGKWYRCTIPTIFFSISNVSFFLGTVFALQNFSQKAKCLTFPVFRSSCGSTASKLSAGADCCLRTVFFWGIFLWIQPKKVHLSSWFFLGC